MITGMVSESDRHHSFIAKAGVGTGILFPPTSTRLPKYYLIATAILVAYVFLSFLSLTDLPGV
jgi:hypothetical protein